MLKDKVRLLGLVAVVLAGTSASAQAQTTLRYKFKAGDTLGYDLEQKMAMKFNLQGKVIAVAVNQTMDLSWTVESVDKDGKAKLKIRFDRLRMTIDSPDSKMTYDSKEDKEPSGDLGKKLAPVLKVMTTVETHMTMDTLGKISDVEVPEKFAKALKEAAGGVADLADMFTPEGLKKMMGQSSLVLPEKAVSKDARWNQVVSEKTPLGEMKVDNTYVYEGTEKQLHKISLKPVVSLVPKAGAAVDVKLKEQKVKGTALFDNEAGRLVEVNMNQLMVLDLGQASQEVDQTVLLKLRKK